MSKIISYRSDIDGLRGIAVSVVVIFHSGLGLTGGYVGVDVFFVISGYLITSIIVRELDVGSFSLVKFWERRVRRILPAATIMTVCTLAGSWFLLLPADFKELGLSAAWQSAFASNIFFWLETGYFDGPAHTKPLLHTWTLAVEEQFYIVLPILLFLFARYFVRASWKSVLLFLSVMAGMSLLFSVYGSYNHPSATFYLLPTRAWELLAGSIVALLPSNKFNASAREATAFVGLLGVVIPCFVYTPETRFPGISAIPPVFGTALLIWSNSNTSTYSPLVNRMLTMRPLIMLGVISYSLYLWHWPLIAFSAYWSHEDLMPLQGVFLVITSLILAWLSWKFIETPFRKKKWLPNAKGLLACGAGMSAVVASFGLFIFMESGIPNRLSADVQLIAAAAEDRPKYYFGVDSFETSLKRIWDRDLLPLGIESTEKKVDVLVFGDSHAMAMLPGLDTYFQNHRISGLAATNVATVPVLGYYHQKADPVQGDNAVSFTDAVFEYVVHEGIPNVFLVANWQLYGKGMLYDRSGNETSLRIPLLKTVEKFHGAGANVYVFLQIPAAPGHVPQLLVEASFFGYPASRFSRPTNDWEGVVASDQKLIRDIVALGATIIDPREVFTATSNDYLILEKEGHPLYYDDNHLSATGSVMMIPLLLEELGMMDQLKKPLVTQSALPDDKG